MVRKKSVEQGSQLKTSQLTSAEFKLLRYPHPFKFNDVYRGTWRLMGIGGGIAAYILMLGYCQRV